ncbi:MAG: hypothetical protein RL375_1009 [Pseudomonadota bacterium]|jgi:hypothetical protein
MASQYKPKKFRVATEGATTDGRKIDRSWIEQMAKNYDPKKYGSRIWMEHMRSAYPDSYFRAYGDVLSLESRQVEDGKLALFAEIQPTADLVDMVNKLKQKIYTSIEVTPSFADTGQAYMTGLAVTDSPASLGTEVLNFAQQKPDASPFKGRKSSPEALFSCGEQTDMAFEPADPAAGDTWLNHFRGVLDKFRAKGSQDDARFSAITEAFDTVHARFTDLAAASAPERKELADLKTAHAKLQADFTALQQKLDNTDPAQLHQFRQRPAATGGAPADQLTDC